MLNRDDNENGFKANRSNKKKKTNCTCSTFFLLISTKQICTCSTLCLFPFPLFCTITTLFCTTKTSDFLVTHYFYGGIVVCAYLIFCFLCSCSLLFSTAAHFHLAGRSLLATSICHFLIATLNFHVFLPTKFVFFVFNNSL